MGNIPIKNVDEVVKVLSSFGKEFVFLVESYILKNSDKPSRKPIVKYVSLENVKDFISEFKMIFNCHIFVTSDVEFVKKIVSDKELYANKFVGLNCAKYKKEYVIPVICCYDEMLEFS